MKKKRICFHLSEDLPKEIKIRTAELEISMSAYIERLIRKDLEGKK